jgi:uncharacterized circularly permuted ATP-grasp superfamily protein
MNNLHTNLLQNIYKVRELLEEGVIPTIAQQDFEHFHHTSDHIYGIIHQTNYQELAVSMIL